MWTRSFTLDVGHAVPRDRLQRRPVGGRKVPELQPREVRRPACPVRSCMQSCSPFLAEITHTFTDTHNLPCSWNDNGGGSFVWTEPSGWSNSMTPLTYFNTQRVIAQNTGNGDYSFRTAWMEKASAGTRFSDQSCGKKRAVAHCSPSGHCARWGLHYNNECDFNSNDVANGFGMSYSNTASRSAGDYIGCCQVNTGYNRAMFVMLWGRI